MGIKETLELMILEVTPNENNIVRFECNIDERIENGVRREYSIRMDVVDKNMLDKKKVDK